MEDFFDFEDDSFAFNYDHATCVFDGLLAENKLEQMNLFLAGISHETFLLENNEAVLKGRALLAFHQGEFTLVTFYKIKL